MRLRFVLHNLWYCTDDTMLYNILVVVVLNMHFMTVEVALNVTLK